MKVSIILKSETKWSDCDVHLEPDQRLSDLMNDDRAFLPITRRTAPLVQKTHIVAKDTIALIVEE
jgi:hypothetical protein